MRRLIYLIKYIRLLKKNKDKLSNSRINNNANGIRYDWLYRLYTVLNLPIDDEENVKRYGYYYIDNMVKNHIAKMNEFFLQLGILEYIRIDTKNVVQIDNFNIKIVLRFKWMNLKTIFRLLIILSIIILIFGIGILFFFI